MNDISAIVLAAGMGKRMNSSIPKVLHTILDKPIIYWTLNLLKELNIKKTIVVTGYEAEKVENEIAKEGFDVTFARQKQALGTADAVKTGLEKVSSTIKNVLVIFGDDSALYMPSTIKEFINFHLQSNNVMTILTAIKSGPSSVGGLKRDENGNIVEILKQTFGKTEVLCGALIFNKEWLDTNLPKIQPNPTNGEYPLPKLIEFASIQKLFAKPFVLSDTREWVSVNTPEELEYANQLKKELTRDRN
ncbi:MAG: hypothetical protein A3D24_04510 [Candidatus Blackburnbacteria bacterium RIFCSPHIGHO2_02_FULL_39_13]|uniref:Bifunctional protein GlmU n=2 Tax=Patescibacteria group TaxID=1783273 RepID=A0A0G1A679_9BACT|nr:MAG: Bifunctional protein GlmU [Candidatus Magasanikbacteria bacterium GW2011_GWA2_42_32]OGY07060.1 MAG: hypothetical protein A2694_01470 [Candidatus Blackburnbacteria bacterium RIFCSPHIGHO2_01_FULL_40_17]OGY08578.1 MAG: hypothetical protein A3D24_04510 [Candidatus Blackburnbacteria bacterium RIFCSPHIGHO2_02_FULL_39_13]OGY13476.1 MAG: hypothetical protein A3A77_00090 [Candidatus Blackburnbacteria bacterium RIFCSPLOWO2_01_FULL_40_20]OGY14992.1 MAG: hypothetical protein A3I52_01335 [Candidatus